MKITLLQACVDGTESLAGRRARVFDRAGAACDADMVVLPELWEPGAFDTDRWDDAAAPITAEHIARFGELAERTGTIIHAGSYLEQDAAGDRYNTSVLFDATGRQAAVYRKVHRFGFDSGEATRIAAGCEVVSAELSSGLRAFTLGLTTCFDLRFPELYRLLALRRPEVIAVVAGWPAARLGAWRALNVARAIENQCFVMACNAAGEHNDVAMGGHSMIIGPTGEILAEAGDDEQTLSATIDLSEVANARESFPVLASRRIDILPTIPPAPKP